MTIPTRTPADRAPARAHKKGDERVFNRRAFCHWTRPSPDMVRTYPPRRAGLTAGSHAAFDASISAHLPRHHCTANPYPSVRRGDWITVITNSTRTSRVDDPPRRHRDPPTGKAVRRRGRPDTNDATSFIVISASYDAACALDRPRLRAARSPLSLFSSLSRPKQGQTAGAWLTLTRPSCPGGAGRPPRAGAPPLGTRTSGVPAATSTGPADPRLPHRGAGGLRRLRDLARPPRRARRPDSPARRAPLAAVEGDHTAVKSTAPVIRPRRAPRRTVGCAARPGTSLSIESSLAAAASRQSRHSLGCAATSRVPRPARESERRFRPRPRHGTRLPSRPGPRVVRRQIWSWRRSSDGPPSHRRVSSPCYMSTESGSGHRHQRRRPRSLITEREVDGSLWKYRRRRRLTRLSARPYLETTCPRRLDSTPFAGPVLAVERKRLLYDPAQRVGVPRAAQYGIEDSCPSRPR